MPVGLTIGAFCLYLAGVMLRRRELLTSAYHASVIAIMFLMLAIPTGILDWHRFYGRAWILEIKMKLILASTLFLLLSLLALIGRYPGARLRLLSILYFLGVLNVVGLGFFGGQLVFRGRLAATPVHLHTGQMIFDGHCAGCHERGGNIIIPDLALRSAPQLQVFEEFVRFIRHPHLPNGEPGRMLIFGRDKLTDEELKDLYDYLQDTFTKPKLDSLQVRSDSPDT